MDPTQLLVLLHAQQEAVARAEHELHAQEAAWQAELLQLEVQSLREEAEAEASHQQELARLQAQLQEEEAAAGAAEVAHTTTVARIRAAGMLALQEAGHLPEGALAAAVRRLCE